MSRLQETQTRLSNPYVRNVKLFASPQVSANCGIYFHVNAKQTSDEPRLSPIETVRCLSCGFAYAKPSGGGTVRANPGCPEGGYVGWVEAPGLTAGPEPPRFSEDHPRRRSA